jgi:adenylate kinase
VALQQKNTVILMGAVGVGKGTQAQKLVHYLKIPQVSTGDILRAEIQNGTELGGRAKILMDRGELLPDDVIIDIVRRRLLQDDAVKGAIFDGFPRTIPQAETLDKLLVEVGLPAPRVVSIDVPTDVIVDRLSARRVCVSCGATYSIRTHPTIEQDHKCPKGRADVIQREDDKAETVLQRLKVYEEKTAPLLGFYKKNETLRIVSGVGNEEQVFARVLIALDPDLT